MIAYDTVTEAISGLKSRGFDLDFNLADNCIICADEKLNPVEFEILELYRFEGDSDPADEAIVYAIQTFKGKKGILVNGYGISAEGLSMELAEKLRMK